MLVTYFRGKRWLVPLLFVSSTVCMIALACYKIAVSF
jgi:hypothetical protein